MFRRFLRARDGNLAITFALAIVPIVFALGATADYGFAARLRARMDAAADSAALAAVTPQNMSQSTTAAASAATQLFNSQVSTLPRLVFNSSNVTGQCVSGPNGTRPSPGFNLCVQVTDRLVANQRVRTAIVAYNAGSQTAFGGVVHFTQIQIGGTSTATASTSPNIDFYLLLDTSPSMAIPSTTDGINQMVALTPYQSNGAGCAFACHESSPSSESNGGTPQKPVFGNQGCPDDPQKRAGGCLDNYALASNANIPLRIQLVSKAVQNLSANAKATSDTTGAAYQLAGYTFDYYFNNIFALQAAGTSAIDTAAQNSIQVLQVVNENSLNGDQNTVFDSSTSSTTGAFPQISAAMNAAYKGAGAGSGTNTPGDHPQQVMMLVTDGVSDQPYGGNRVYNPIGGSTNLGSGINQWCTNIKSTNVRIAVLYLVYNPLPMTDGQGNQSWYAGHVAPVANQIAPVLQTCASAGLFYQVNTNGDISAAMNSLFQSAVNSARLSN